MMTLTRHDGTTSPVRQYCDGPLASHLEGFAAQLLRMGYAPNTVHAKCDVLADLSRWLGRRQIPLAKLNETRLRQFQEARRLRNSVRRCDLATGQQFLAYLRDQGDIAPAVQQIDRTASACLIRAYEVFLYTERGLSRSTAARYLPIIRCFLDERFGCKIPRLERLRPQDLHDFILREMRRVSRSHGKLIVTALRSFLRFLLQRGAIQTDLACTLPGVACWRLSHLPKSLPPDQVKRLLACCNRSTPAGERDYAILLLLARLGLRGGEVLAMTLDDRDWERGEIVVRGKGQRLERLPMASDVGAALVNYLRDVRPACATRRVFIRMKAPHQGLAVTAICCIVRRAIGRAGLAPEFKGAHLLRHSLATDLLRRGATLGEIGQLLRHRQPITTQIYARVDIAALRDIALPWPGGAS
ncbi:tyrosine-type recombinase/integrase [Paraburkholderia caribensis]|uniref:Tyrosine-type recombinase/integrase n=2 Tax=Paraburkholderia caribensis TaxID=75105 RepID=A0ABV0E752_9BURK|nr:tyrosine-type recombinase/integrase [Paraburkholderia caribensis]PTB24842.1 integrase [Paraburkholderia caribensis]